MYDRLRYGPAEHVGRDQRGEPGRNGDGRLHGRRWLQRAAIARLISRPAATFSADTANQQTVFDTATATLAAGAHTLSVDVPNCFFQVDFVLGSPISTLGPAGSSNFYGAQGRLISAMNGGTTSCSAGAPATGGTTDTTGTAAPGV